MAGRSPHGLSWWSLMWFQEPGHGRKLGEKGKHSRELLQKGLFAVSEWTGLLACGRNGPPLLAFPTAPHDFCSWASSLVSAGRRAAGPFVARLERGLIGFSWSNIPWRSLSDIEMRQFQSKSICNIRSAEDLQKLHSMPALVGESVAGWGPAEATLLPNRSRSPGQAHRTPISRSGNSPQLTTTRETSYTSPQETEPEERITGFQAEAAQSVMSSIPHHCGDTLCHSSATHWDTKHLLAWQLWLLCSRTGGENQPLGNAWPSHEVCHFASECYHCSQRSQSHHSLCCMHGVTGLQWSLLHQHRGSWASWSKWSDPAQTLTCRCFNAITALLCQSKNSRSGSLGKWKSGFTQ